MANIFGPKNLSKTTPKRGPNPLKIDAKNVQFFNIDFLGFGPRFWSLLGLQVGAKLAILAQNSGGGGILVSLRQNDQLGSKLEAQEAPKSSPKPEKIDVKKQHVFGIDFERVRTSFWKGFW